MLSWKPQRWAGATAWAGGLLAAGTVFGHPPGTPDLAVVPLPAGVWAWAGGLAALIMGGLCWWRGRRREGKIKQQTLDFHLEEARHRALFDNTPVQILEEDLTAVVAAFAPLRSQGVFTHLWEFFMKHPEQPREWLRLVRLVDANQPAVAAAGCATKGDLIARFPQLDVPPYQEIFDHQLEQLWAGSRLFEEELRYLDARGQERACLVQCKLSEREGRPDPSRVVLVLLDITTAKRTVAAQMENQELLRRILGRANILLWWAQVRKEDGRFRWKINIPSQSFDSPIFKLATAMDSGGLWEIEHAPDLAETSQRAEEALLSGKPGYQQVFRAISREGVTHWLSEDVGISRLEENEWSFVGVVRDITEQHQAEAARQTSEARLQQLLRQADCMLWQVTVTRADGELHWGVFDIPNSVLYERLAGKVRNDADYRLWSLVDCPDLPEMNRRSTAAILAGVSDYEQEFRIVQSEATLRLHEQVSITPMGSDAWSLVGVITDVTAQHRSEEVRKASEAQQRQILNRADCMLWQARAIRVGGVLQWRQFEVPGSMLYKRIFGTEHHESDHDLWASVNVPELPEMDRRSANAILAGAPGYEQEFRVVKADATLWLHEQVTAVQLGPDEWAVVGVLMDVTARHEAEEERRKSQAQLRQILSRADCMVWQARVAEAAGQFTWEFDIPPSGLQKRIFGGDTGVAHKGISGIKAKSLYGNFSVPEQAGMDVCVLKALRSGAPGYEQEYRLIKGDHTLWLHERVSITAVEPGQWDLVGISIDVTAQREADDARKTTEARLQQILERVDCVLWQAHVTEADGRTVWAFELPQSSLRRQIFGSKAVTGEKELYDNLTVPELPEMGRRSDAALRAGEPGYEQEFRIVKPGRTYWLHERVSITPQGKGQWLIFGVMLDVSALKMAEEARRASEAQLREILERVDCLLWHARVTEIDGQNDWVFDIPPSGLHRRIFGGEGIRGRRNLYANLNIPEMDEMHARSAAAFASGAPGYEQVFRVVKPERTYWLDERVSITPQGPGQWLAFGVMIDISAAKEAEEAVRASEARYHDLFEGAVEGVFQSTPVGRFVSVNPSLTRIFGCATPAEFMAWTEGGAKSLYVKAGRREEFFSELGVLDSVTDFESEVSCRDGSTKWISENVRAVRDAEGRLLHLQGFLSDVTERHKALMAVRESENRYRALFENIPAAILELDLRGLGQTLQGWYAAGVRDLTAYLAGHPGEFAALAAAVKVAAVNETAVRLYHAESKVHLQNEISRLFTTQVFAALQRGLESIWQGHNAGEAEAECGDFVGGRHHVYLHWWMPRRAEWLQLEYAVVALMDFTELKQAEAALAAEKERLTVTLRAMAEGVITTDTRGIVQFINRAAAELTQCDAATAVGRPLAEICVLRGPRSDEAFVLPLALVLEERALVDLPPQTRLMGRNGAFCLVEGCCAPVHDAESEIIGAVLVIRDVTVRQRFEEELERGSRLESIGILAGGIAHDFNNILTAVMGNITLALLDAGGLATVERYLQEAERATVRARDLTQQLLTFAKGGSPVRTAVLLPEIIREVAQFALHGSRVKCEFDLPPGLWPADADKGQLGQVVQNLVINAVQAMPEGGSMRIGATNETVGADTQRSYRPGDYVRISVADTGTGIKPDHLAKIFDPYFTTKQHGSGLGLTTVYSIIHKHEGHIEVESELGRGTTFHLWLPALRDKEQEAGEDREGAVVPMEGRVLFMDDEESIVAMAGPLLRRLGFEAELVRDGAEAVRKFSEAYAAGRPFDLVVMDLTVPGGVGGREAIEQLRRIDPDVRAIVSSGYSSDPVLANHRAYGFRGMVAKPYKVEDFARVLRAVLRSSHPPFAGGAAAPPATPK